MRARRALPVNALMSHDPYRPTTCWIIDYTCTIVAWGLIPVCYFNFERAVLTHILLGTFTLESYNILDDLRIKLALIAVLKNFRYSNVIITKSALRATGLFPSLFVEYIQGLSHTIVYETGTVRHPPQ